MAISYKRLWKLLIDREMKKKDLMDSAGISWSTITKEKQLKKPFLSIV